jgi:putative hydrolase of the HAD superfamily
VAYQGLILDFAGVLTSGTGTSQRAWCVSQGLPPDSWRHALVEHPEGREWYGALESGRMSQTEWNLRTSQLLGLDDGTNLMGRAWAHVTPAQEMIDLARSARSAGMTVAMLSNSFGLDPYDPYDHMGVWELFDVAVISEREGIAKPDPRIYELVLARMGLPPTACVFVDDAPANLPPAAALGITTLHAAESDNTVRQLARLLAIS